MKMSVEMRDGGSRTEVFISWLAGRRILGLDLSLKILSP